MSTRFFRVKHDGVIGVFDRLTLDLLIAGDAEYPRFTAAAI